MRKIDQNLLIFCMLFLLGSFACAPQYTANFRNTPFYEEDREAVAVSETAPAEVQTVETPVIEPVAPVEAPVEMEASTKKGLVSQLAEIPSVKQIVEEHKENVKSLKESGLEQKELQKEIRKEEKRAQKEVKKQLLKEMKEVKKAEDKNAMNQKIFIGIVIAAAGIIIAILASSGLGAVAIIVGVGLIAWGIIEQGGV